MTETMNLIDRRQILKYGLATASAAALPAPAFAYPDRAIRLIVPFSPGGATDVAARLWADKMKPSLGTIVVENKGGGGGAIGANEVARSQPDGHTFLFGNTSTQVLIPALMPRPLYDGVKDFAGVFVMCLSPTCIVVHESVPARARSPS
jgi:tripartite-type tricarboxylate transporter receptor subunit TctC